MHLVSLTDLNDYCRRALGQISKIYLHWTAGRYNQQFDDYHINIDRDGNIYIDGELTDHKNHTYMRNGSAVGIALDCAYGAQWTDNLGEYAPTDAQIETLAQVVALLCVDLGIPCDIRHVLTHAEAADNMDGYYAHEPYGPTTTCERWDLWAIREGDVPGSGGDVIRGKAKYYAQQWGSNI
jgi:hypothetical protein